MQILFCDTELSIRLIYYVKTFLNVLKFLIPLGLILKVTLDLYHGILTGNDDKGEIITKSRNRIIAAIIIFFVPTLVGAILSIFDDQISSSYRDSFYSCYRKADLTLIKSIQDDNQE